LLLLNDKLIVFPSSYSFLFFFLPFPNSRISCLSLTHRLVGSSLRLVGNTPTHGHWHYLVGSNCLGLSKRL
jgi:hypothetical protein